MDIYILHLHSVVPGSTHLQTDLQCVEWDVKPHYTIPVLVSYVWHFMEGGGQPSMKVANCMISISSVTVASGPWPLSLQTRLANPEKLPYQIWTSCNFLFSSYKHNNWWINRQTKWTYNVASVWGGRIIMHGNHSVTNVSRKTSQTLIFLEYNMTVLQKFSLNA